MNQSKSPLTPDHRSLGAHNMATCNECGMPRRSSLCFRQFIKHAAACIGRQLPQQLEMLLTSTWYRCEHMLLAVLCLSPHRCLNLFGKLPGYVPCKKLLNFWNWLGIFLSCQVVANGLVVALPGAKRRQHDAYRCNRIFILMCIIIYKSYIE